MTTTFAVAFLIGRFSGISKDYSPDYIFQVLHCLAIYRQPLSFLPQTLGKDIICTINKRTINTQVCCGYPSLGSLCRLGFRGSLRRNCHRRVFHVHASCIRCSFVPSFSKADLLGPSKTISQTASKHPDINRLSSPGYSWLASKVDLRGNGNSFIFLGTNLGWLIFPPIAGLLIFSGPGGVGVFLLAFGGQWLH